MPEIVSWQSADPRETIARAVQHLHEGRLVVFPSEYATIAAASALAPQAVALLGQIGGQPLSIAVDQPARALDWAPRLSSLGQRFVRKGCPGSWVLATTEGVDSGSSLHLPEAVRACLCPEQMLHLWMPDHEALLFTLDLLGSPVVVAPVSSTVSGVAGDEAAMLIEDGLPASGGLTVVRVAGNDWSILRKGVLGPEAFEQMALCRIIFVCTGNTCRSPLAEALCGKLLSERLGCTPSELASRGYAVMSAGLAAFPGEPATPEAVEVARELGADLTRHQSRTLSVSHLLQADHVLVMTQTHLDALAAVIARGIGPEPRLLSPHGHDVDDPIGGSPDVYRTCAEQIRKHLEEWLPLLLAD
jgi:protein-tyrosine phosphatase